VDKILFQGFYDLLEEYILSVVENSRKSRKILGSLNSTILALISNKGTPSSFEYF
jgi:hypothetical protein